MKPTPRADQAARDILTKTERLENIPLEEFGGNDLARLLDSYRIIERLVGRRLVLDYSVKDW